MTPVERQVRIVDQVSFEARLATFFIALITSGTVLVVSQIDLSVVVLGVGILLP